VWSLPLFDSTGLWTQGLTLARQAIYHWSHSLPPSALVIFFGWGIGSCTVLPGAGLGWQSSYLCFLCVGTSGLHHLTWLVCWDGVPLTFCLDWPWTMILLISASPVAGIIGMHHHIWPWRFLRKQEEENMLIVKRFWNDIDLRLNCSWLWLEYQCPSVLGGIGMCISFDCLSGIDEMNGWST
jgi:hypothetical protein